MRLVSCDYITDEALEQLELLRISLKELEIYHCSLITDKGLKSLDRLWYVLISNKYL